MTFSMTVDMSEVTKAMQKLPNATKAPIMEKACVAAAIPITARAKALCPVDMGALMASIGFQTTELGPGKVTVSVGTNMIYARQVEYGGRIFPKNKRLLAWKGPDGTWHFAKSVWQRPQPYMRPAFDSTKNLAMAAGMHVLIQAAGLK